MVTAQYMRKLSSWHCHSKSASTALASSQGFVKVVAAAGKHGSTAHVGSALVEPRGREVSQQEQRTWTLRERAAPIHISTTASRMAPK